MNRKLLPIFLIISFAFACSKPMNLQHIVNDYYKTYEERVDFEKFMIFYADDIMLEDMISGEAITGKKALKEFFDWNNLAYQKIHKKTLIIDEQIFDGNKIVCKGYFTPFKWGEIEYEAMHFTTILTFNSSGKIRKQVDWINYPNNLIDYQNRKNSNNWINP